MQTIMKDRKHGETIIDNSPKEPFISPLQAFIFQNCEKCNWNKGRCRLDDAQGMKRIELCIILYTHQQQSIQEIMAQAQEALNKTAQIAEGTLEELQEAEQEIQN